MNEPPNQSLQWIAAARRPLSFIVSLRFGESVPPCLEGHTGRIASFDNSGRVTAHSEMIIPPPAQRCAIWMYNALPVEVSS